jgi:hypothetical protein
MIIGFSPQRNPQNPPKKHCEKYNYVKMLSKKEITPENVEISRVFWLITHLLKQSAIFGITRNHIEYRGMMHTACEMRKAGKPDVISGIKLINRLFTAVPAEK